MFHLQARVHFQKVSLLGVGIEDKFHGTSAFVIEVLPQTHGAIEQLLPHFVIQVTHRCFFDDFLVITLDGTLTIEQMHHVTVTITQHLHFNMTRAHDVFFQQHTIITEGVHGFLTGLL